jgi:tetrahydromethanopterin S-methyltransferase subunit G
MQTMRESWTDELLDEFGKRMDERFDQVDERFDDVQREMRQEFKQVDRRFGEVDKRLDRLGAGLESVQKAIVFAAITMSTAFVAGFITMATQI